MVITYNAILTPAARRREHDTGGTPAAVRVKYFWGFDKELAPEKIVSLHHPTITRGSESNVLSDLPRDFDTGGTPAAAGT